MKVLARAIVTQRDDESYSRGNFVKSFGRKLIEGNIKQSIYEEYLKSKIEFLRHVSREVDGGEDIAGSLFNVVLLTYEGDPEGFDRYVESFFESIILQFFRCMKMLVRIMYYLLQQRC